MKGMKGFVAASLVIALYAVPALAQAPAEAPAPQQSAPAGAPTSAQPQPPAPFPQGAKFAFVNLQGIAQLSVAGKAATAKVQKLQQQKQKEGDTKAKALQAAQQALEANSNVWTEAKRAQAQKDIEKQQRDGERFEQDAQAEINELTQELQNEFNKKLFPILDQLAKEKNLEMLFSATDAGLVWAQPGLDLTMEAVKRLDASTGTGEAAAPRAAAPAAAAAKPAAPAAPRPATPAAPAKP